MKCNMEMLSKYGDLAHLALRLPMAVIFILHGIMKWSIWTSGAPIDGFMDVMMRVLSIAEPLAGIALLIGLLTRWASMGLIIVMVGAIYVKITAFNTTFIGQRTTGWEFDFILLGVAIALMILGAGRYSLDHMWCKKYQNKSVI